MKKKIFSILAIIMMLATAGCSSDNNSKTIASIDDLPGASIGVQLGTTGDIYASDYEAPEYGSTVERFNKITDAVQALKQGKIDCVIADEQPAIASIETESGLYILDEPFTLEEYAMVVAKDNDTLLDSINEALSELKEDGTIDSIVSNYIGDDTKGQSPYVTPEGTTYENGTLVVATNAAFKPYEYYDGSDIVGIDIDIIRAIGDKLHMDIVIEDMEFDAIINAVSSHKADVGIAGMTMTEERAKSINFSESYVTTKQVIIVKGDNTSASDLSLVEKIKQNFIDNDRWVYILSGLKNTLIIALCAVILGVLIGFLVGVIRVTHDKTGLLPILNAICKLYLTIIRGTPAMIQLLIIYYVVFQSVNVSKILVAVIAFAINSGAYVAEIMRGGIMSIDDGQTEAGRSLGLSYRQTMISIILPQAVKNVLPALANEFITLIKETSICGYIGLTDLTRGGDIIRSQTYEAFLPLIAVALIYLIIVEILTVLVGRWEKSLRKSER
ncbi:MAG: ABC transporter substrate-binding protein/permease [Butyrivibrio sp.]|uniref:ABC transporter substrate-binding protein/permease n=1 Tax=Butyrivibrio sp. TaxID=28121 RepID=UPI0025E6EADC|nr:ABC transporter substrate-binding protein/permease [Butyrivibrio sp.]MCR5772857.1 ABC transporter substrate-binding protein/permease [Butyrivibrio sp.]